MAKKDVSSGTKRVNITPPPRFLDRALSATNIGLSQGLSELIANSIDWLLLSKEEADDLQSLEDEGAKKRISDIETEYGALEVVTLSKDESSIIAVTVDDTNKSKPFITLIDNGVGMTFDELRIAFTPSEVLTRSPLRSRKGMYNMGLKAGWLGIAKEIEIISKSVKATGTVSTKINSESFAAQSEWSIDITQQEGVHDHLKEIGLEHGTIVRISKLHKKNHNWENSKWDISRNFSASLLTGLEIQWNGEKCIQEEPDWDKKIGCIDLAELNLFVPDTHGDGSRGEPVQITGEVGLLRVSQGGSAGNYGVHLTRHGQLIEEFHNDGTNRGGLWPYPNPHPRFQRLFGKIELNMVPPNFHKKGWNTESEAWGEVASALKETFEGLVAAVEKKVTDADEQKQAAQIISAIRQKGKWQLGPSGKAKKKKRKAKKKSDEGKKEEEDGDELSPYEIDGESYIFPDALTNEDSEAEKPWVYATENLEILITYNIHHPMWKIKGSHEILVIIAQIDAFCQIMAGKGMDAQVIEEKRFSLYNSEFGED